jgi:serine/threonine protein kinase
MAMLIDVIKGLISIHKRNVIHRDIKPENIIFKEGVYKITDFGISTDDVDDDSFVGTYPYLPP